MTHRADVECGLAGYCGRWCQTQHLGPEVGSSGDVVIGMKGAVKGCGSCVDGVK